MKAVIIEDEEKCRVVMQNLLQTYCPDVDVIDTADSVSAGVNVLRNNKPDLVFMDIEISDGTGFDILSQVERIEAAVIFTTAYDQFALKAFRCSAIDYLLKPIDIDELQEAVGKVRTSRQNISDVSIQNLLSNLRNPQEPPVLLISTLDTVEFVRVDEIVRCEAQGAYTKIILREGKPVMVSKVIKEYDYLLKDHGFYRVHQSHLINLRDVQKYIKPDNALLMRDGAYIQLARSRKEDFFSALNSVV